MNAILVFWLSVWAVSRAHNQCSHIRRILSLSQHSESRSCLPNDCCDGFGQQLETRAQQSWNQLLPTLSQQTESHVKHILETILDSSHQRMDQLFNDQRVRGASHRLYQTIKSRLLTGKIIFGLESSFETLFDYIFVNHLEKQKVFNSEINSDFNYDFIPKKKSYSSQYVSCLTTIRKELLSFQSVTTRVERAIDDSRLLLRSILLSEQTLNTSQLISSQQCLQQWVSVSFCGQCSGHVTSRPCRGLCESAISACFSPLASLDERWKRFLQLFSQFVAQLVSDRNPETVLSSVPTLISEALSKLNHHVISQKVKLGCGSPRRYQRSIVNSTQDLTQDSSESLFIGLQTISHEMSKSKDFFSSMSMRICQHHPIDNCWNGISIGQFSKPSEEKLEDNIHITDLISKLKKISESLESNVRQSDQLLSDGSGHWDNTLMDDEDYHSDIGSASGEGELIDTPIVVTQSEPKGSANQLIGWTGLWPLLVIVFAIK